ncbi:MAG TPA: TonB-dependent receptor [Puia sp.]|nr:TonB-dependent receptor [Puia sp.]
MKRPSLLIFFFVLMGFNGIVSAQQNKQALITANFQSVAIDSFAYELEIQSGYRFYYDPSRFDSLRITLSVNQQPLMKVLDLAFAGTNFYFSTDASGRVFISQGQAVKTNLPEGLFSGVIGNKQSAVNIPGPEEEPKRKTGQKAAIENKIYEIGDKNADNGQPRATIAGYVIDASNGEHVVGASVYVEKSYIGVSTDQYGYYSISLPKGRYILNIQSIGMRDTRRQIVLYGQGKMNIELQPQVMTLKNVIVSAQKLSNVRSTQMGVQKIDIKTIKQVPVVFGEADLLRVVLTMPGVKSVGESSTGLNVRGGSADQNLILFNDATIFNPSHFFGLFSAFNPETVKDVQLYKSSIPARYGGRLSSVLDINGREGNQKNFTGVAGIGVLTSRLEIEGPLIKDKSSFIIGGRTTYANWLLNLLPDQYKNSRASFYDITFNISHQINKKNNLYITGYLSKDRFNLNSDTIYSYSNKNISLKWKHIFGNKLYGLFSTGYDGYEYNISSDQNPLNGYKLSFDINQLYFKAHFNYYLSPNHTVEFGLNSIFYKLHPGSYQPWDSKSLVIPDVVAAEQGLESALYLSDHYNISPTLAIDAGIRYSVFNYLGPQNVNTYPVGQPKTEDNITGTIYYPSGKFIKTYSGPEYRVSARYSFSEDFSMKAGYNTQRQYIHVISNTTAQAPTDIWKLSDPNIKPQYGDQLSLGFYKNFKSNTIETSVEVYYKNIKDYLDYKSGAILVLNHHIETDVFNTKGKAYGVELLLKKATGKLNGWISYTYSRTFLKMDDSTAGEVINRGQYYPANYDIPNEITLVGNYRITHRYSFSLNMTYATGRPITIPIGTFYYSGSLRTLYADRNSYRIPDYFRTDVAINIDGNHKVTQRYHVSWTIGVYNLTGRKNPYSVYFISENGIVNGYKLSIFGSAIPYLNFNIAFK